MITPRLPYSPMRGDGLILYHRLRILCANHEITLFAFYQNSSQLEEINRIKPFCKQMYLIYLPKWKSYLNILWIFWKSDLPLQVLFYTSHRFRQSLREHLKENEYDVVHGFMLRIVPYLSDISVPKVLELIDSMQLNIKRNIPRESGLKRLLYTEELKRVRDYESKIDEFADYTVVVAEKDRELISSTHLEVIPNGVNTSVFLHKDVVKTVPSIIFSGNMNYSPNIHAVEWFVDNCLPKIQSVISDICFIIAGANPTSKIRALAKHNPILVTGYVDSMPETLNQANLAIAPMQSGSGIQNKILEAMACELPVVTTTLGLGSIKAQPEREIFVADTPEEFIAKVITLFKEPIIAKEMGKKAREFVIANHSWEKAARQIEEIYAKSKTT